MSTHELRGCGDSGCIISRPRGMATNGGCRCLDDVHDFDAFVGRLRRALVHASLIERTARRLCEALGEDDKPRGEAIDEMRRVLGMEPWR